MRATRTLVLVMVLAVAGAGAAFTRSAGDVGGVGLLCDEGFEAGSVDVVTTPAAIASCEWKAVNREPGVVTELSTLSHTGTYSARVDTIGETDGGYFYQDFAQVSSCFLLRVWVRRSADDNVIRLMADWDRGPSGTNTPVTSVFLDTGTFRLDAWSGPLIDGTVAVSGSNWFEVTVIAAGDYSVQGLLIRWADVGSGHRDGRGSARDALAG